MFVPGISKRSSSTLERRKGGGGGGGGGGKGGGGGGGGKSSGSSGGKSSGGGGGVSSGSSGGGSSGGGSVGTPRTSSSGNFGGSPNTSSSYSRGGGKAGAVPAGLPFAGRSAGGGTRDQVYGSRSYGSGYGSGFAGRGVGGRPFPFFFWPIVFGGGALLATGTYLDARQEYGDANNSTRPGGPLATTTFQSSIVNSTFRVVADNNTVTSLIFDLSQYCSPNFVASPAPTSTPLNPNASIPRPEQVIQYYRASSVALTLDGYNNTATYAPDGTPDSPLPSGVDMVLLNCLNQTIGAAVPLVNGANALWAPSHFNLIGLVCALWVLMKFH